MDLKKFGEGHMGGFGGGKGRNVVIKLKFKNIFEKQ